VLNEISTWRGLTAGLRAMQIAPTALGVGPSALTATISVESGAATAHGEVRRTVLPGARWKF